MIRLKIAKRSSSVKSHRQGIRALRQPPAFRNASAIKSKHRLLRIVLTAKMKKLQHTKNKAIKKRFSSNNYTVPILQSLGLVIYHHSLAYSNYHHRFHFLSPFVKCLNLTSFSPLPTQSTVRLMLHYLTPFHLESSKHHLLYEFSWTWP